MRTIRTVAEMRAWLGNARAEGRSVGLVPTMGAFHAGHHSLMQAAREEQDSVVVSLFVNPAQFNDARDLAAYPRTEANDAAEAARARRRRPVRPAGQRDLPRRASPRRSRSAGSPRCSRAPSAARGTSPASARSSTSCCNIVGPDVAYFGQKDAQQVAVVKRMVRDLDMPVEDRGHADRARAGRPRAVLAQRPAVAGRPRAARSASRRALNAAAAVVDRRRARRGRDPRRRAGRDRRRRGRVPRDRRPPHLRPAAHRRAPARWSPSPRRSGPSA